MSDGDNPFLLPPQDVDGGGVDARTHHDKNVTTAEQSSTSPASGKDNNNVDEEAGATAATRRDDVNDLIPLCVQHASGPRLSTAVYGYDIAQMQRRPWREPGAKITDYFNYGFNETSWRAYCALQKEGEASLLARAEEVLRKLQQAAGSSGGVGVGQSRGMMGAAQSASRFGARSAITGAAPVGHTPSPLPQPSSSPLSSSARAAHTHMPMTSGSDVYGQHMSSAYKTRMCQHHLEGRCGRGAHCNYAHSVTELRTLQPAATTTAAAAPSSSSAMPLPPPPPVQPAAERAYGGQTPMAAGASDNYYAHTLLPGPSAATMPPPPPHATRYPSPPYTQGGSHVLPPPPPHAAPADYYAAPPPPHMPSGGSGASMLPPPPSAHDLRSHDGSDGQASLYRAEAVPQSGYVPPHPHMRYDTSMPPPPAGEPYRRQAY